MASRRSAAAGLLGIVLAGCGQATIAPEAVDAPVTTRGRVIGLECADHGAVTYAFHAGGQVHRRRAAAGAAACASARVGDTVVVSYLPSDPDSNEPLAAPVAPPDRHGHRARDGWIAGGGLVLVAAMLAGALRGRPGARERLR